MKYGSALYAEIQNEYERRRKEATARSDYYKDLLLSDPEFTETLNAYKTARFDASKAKTDGNAELSAAEFKKAKTLLLELKKMRDDKGVTEEMLRPAYSCPKCKDTGYDENGEQCECFYSVAIGVATADLGIKKRAFPSFDDLKYLDKNGLSTIYEKMKKYCSTFKVGSKNVVLSGKVGTGKSHIAECVTNELMKNGFAAVFLTATELNNVFLKYHLSPIEEKSLYFELLTGCDLLVIDDLGTEPVLKNVTNNYLLAVLSDRLSNGMPYIVTTNLTQEEILDRYDERIHSRLLDKKHGVFIKVDGEDLRLLK